MTSESDIQAAIRLDFGLRPDLRLFRNNQGLAWTGCIVNRGANTITLGNPRQVRFVLAEGASDLIGIKAATVTPEMLGQTVGVFCAVEVKQRKKYAESHQEKFLDMVQRLGGLCGVARSTDDVEAILRGERLR